MKNKLREKYMAFKFRMKGIQPNPFKLATKLEKSQYWDRNEIENFQLKMLNKRFNESRENVEFYGMSKYSHLDNFKNLKQFKEKIPVLNKEDIKINSRILVNKNNIKSNEHETSGSTGQPMRFLVSNEAESYRFANNVRFFHWWDLSIYDKNILIWKVRPKTGNGILSSLKKLETRFLGRRVLNVFDLNDNSILDYFQTIEKFKPKYIRGYKSGVYELARLMDKNDLRFSSPFLKLAIVTSETLEDYERNLISKVFQCKVANEYGSAEAGLFSLECPHGSLHINEESVFIYTDKNQNSYVTELFNNAMPLINYKNNDSVIINEKKCSCGKSLKVIDTVRGRVGDFIQLKDGTRIHSFAIGMLMGEINEKFEDSIYKYKVIQQKTKLIIKIIPCLNFNKNIIGEIQNLVKCRISSEFDVQVIIVDNIPREKSGKLRSFVRQS